MTIFAAIPKHQALTSDRLLSLACTVAVVYVTLGCIERIMEGNGSKLPDGFKEIPTPSEAHLYFGQTRTLDKDSAHIITEWQKKLGKIIRLKINANYWIFLNDADTVQHVLGQRKVAELRISGGNLLSNAEEWGNKLAQMQKLYNTEAVCELDELLKKEACQFVDKLIEGTKSMTNMDPLRYARLYAINIILIHLFGIPGVTTVKDPLYKEAVKAVLSNAKSLWMSPQPKIYPKIVSSFMQRVYDEKQYTNQMLGNNAIPMIERLVNAARRSQQSNFIRTLDAYKVELDLEEIDIHTFLNDKLSQSENVAVAIAWAYALLCRFTNVQTRLALEIDSFCARRNRLPEFEDQHELPYYSAFHKECLRFRPSVYFTAPCRATTDFISGNYIIAKGETVVVNIHAMLNDEKIFPKPESFMPERFFNTSEKNAIAGQYILGLGIRDHFNVDMAQRMIFYAVTRLISRCTIEPQELKGNKRYPSLEVKQGGYFAAPAPFLVRIVPRKAVSTF